MRHWNPTAASRHWSVVPFAFFCLVLAAIPETAVAQSPLEGLGTAAIETADERLSARLTGILQALAASSGGPQTGMGTARHESPPLLGERGELVGPGGIPLFDLWAKPYGAYWDRPSDGDAAGSTGKRGGLAVGAALPVDSDWSLGVLGGADYSEIDYSNGEEADATAVFAGADARFRDDSGYFAGVAVVGGYAWNEIEQPLVLGIGPVQEKAEYGATFIAVVGNAGKRIPLASEKALRLSTSVSYIGEWTDAYNYDGLLAGVFEVDSHYVDAIDGRLEIALEKQHHFARGGVVEIFAGLLGHYQFSGEQGLIFGGVTPLTVPDPSVESVAGFVGGGLASHIGFNWGISGRAQVSYASDETKAIAAYLRVLGVF